MLFAILLMAHKNTDDTKSINMHIRLEKKGYVFDAATIIIIIIIMRVYGRLKRVLAKKIAIIKDR